MQLLAETLIQELLKCNKNLETGNYNVVGFHKEIIHVGILFSLFFMWALQWNQSIKSRLHNVGVK